MRNPWSHHLPDVRCGGAAPARPPQAAELAPAPIPGEAGPGGTALAAGRGGLTGCWTQRHGDGGSTDFTWLLVWNITVFFHIWGIMLPSDEIIFSGVETTNQITHSVGNKHSLARYFRVPRVPRLLTQSHIYVKCVYMQVFLGQ